MIQPIEDKNLLKQFHQDFNLMRPLEGEISQRAGTSVVIPWYDPSLTFETLIDAVIENSFPTIAKGLLEITIEHGDGRKPVLLSSETIEQVVTELEQKSSGHILELIKLALWAEKNGEISSVTAIHEPTSGAVKWGQYSLKEIDRDRLHADYEMGKPVAVRVPVPMRTKSNTRHTSHLDVFLVRSETEKSMKPVLVRGSVVIPDHGISKAPSAVAIIQSTDKDELAALLRSSEDPGHKEFSTSTWNFRQYSKDVYVYAPSFLSLTRRAAYGVYQLLLDSDNEKDVDILRDVFSLPRSPDEDGTKSGGTGKKKRRSKKPIVVIDPSKKKPRILSVSKHKDGFSIGRFSSDSPIPDRIRVGVAYDIDNKDAFDNWDELDFRLDKKPIHVESGDGLEVEKVDGCRIVAKVKRADFKLSITGFDVARGDLIIDAKPEGRFNVKTN